MSNLSIRRNTVIRPTRLIAIDISERFVQLTAPLNVLDDGSAEAKLDGHPEPDHHRNAVSSVWGCVCCSDPGLGQAMTPSPALGLFWTPYADWIYTAVSLSGVLLICWLVLGRSKP